MRTPALPFSYKWFVLALTMAGIFMGAVDVTAVILAIPQMMADLHANLVSIVWVLMSYTFMTTVLLLAIGRVADLYGRARLYNIGFALFTVASALCGLSGGPGQLIASRVLQGAGGALMLVNSWPIVTEAFPPNERGAAIGINSMVFGLGSIVGPVMGGLILRWANWRWIFYINIPVGVVGTVAGYLYLKELSKPPSGEKLDGVGAFCFSAALFALLLALTRGNQAGWTSASILALLGFFVAGLFLLPPLGAEGPLPGPRPRPLQEPALRLFRGIRRVPVPRDVFRPIPCDLLPPGGQGKHPDIGRLSFHAHAARLRIDGPLQRQGLRQARREDPGDCGAAPAVRRGIRAEYYGGPVGLRPHDDRPYPDRHRGREHFFPPTRIRPWEPPTGRGWGWPPERYRRCATWAWSSVMPPPWPSPP